LQISTSRPEHFRIYPEELGYISIKTMTQLVSNRFSIFNQKAIETGDSLSFTK